MIDSAALKWTLGTPLGRKVIWDLLAVGGLFRQPHSPDERQTNFNCGSLNIALILYAECLAVSPEHTALMTKEQADYDNRERSESDESGSDSSGDGPRKSTERVKALAAASNAGVVSELDFDRFFRQPGGD